MRLDLVRHYYTNNNSAIVALRKYKHENGLRNDLCDVSAVRKLIMKFETTFSLHDKPKTGRPSLQEDREEMEAIDDTKN